VAFQRGRRAAEETAKAECLRRWPELQLQAEARYYEGGLEGYVVFKNGDSSVSLGAARSASEAWGICLGKLEEITK